MNSEKLKKQKEQGTERKLVGFEVMERGIPRHGYEIIDEKGKAIGQVTSGTMSPSLGKGIGLGYVPSGLAKEGTLIYIHIRKKAIPARIVKLPFYKQ